MKKFPFTPKGVQAMQKESNALSVDERLKIAEYAASNPVGFISENFSFSKKHFAYGNPQKYLHKHL